MLILFMPTKIANQTTEGGAKIMASLSPVFGCGDDRPHRLHGVGAYASNVPSRGGTAHPSSTWFPEPPESTAQTAYRSVYPFLHGTRS